MKKSTNPRNILCKYMFVWRHCLLILTLVLIAGCTAKEQRSIVILYENDVHCNIEGYAKMRGLGDAISDTAWVGLTSSGDILHGGTAGVLSKGKFLIDIMKHMNYDAIALGNHEFDFGIPKLLEDLEGSNLPIVCANLFPMNSQTPIFTPYIIRKYGDKSIAFIGVVTPESLTSEQYAFFDNDGNQLYSLSEDSLIQLVQSSVNKVNEIGVDYVVLLSHFGDKSDVFTSHELVAETYGIDIVLDAHSHSIVPCDTLTNKSGRKVIISQTGHRFKNIGKLLIDADGNISTELIPLDSVHVENAVVRHITDSIEHQISLATSRFVCHSDYQIIIFDEQDRQIVRYAETAAGNLVCDAFRAISGAQIAINNGGGIRAELPAGDWTYGDIITVLPFQNILQTAKIKGSKLEEMLVVTTANSPKEDGQFPQISGFRFTLDTLKTGRERVSQIEILDEKTGRYLPMDKDAYYTLCTSNYCITGGGLYNVLHDIEVINENVAHYFDALATYVEKDLNGHIPERYSSTEGRINFK